MGKIVNVAVIDLTRPVVQKGFKSGLLFDTTAEQETAIVTDTKSLKAGSEILKIATAFFANGGSSLLVSGKATNASAELTTALQELALEQEFYLVMSVVAKEKQKELYGAIKEFVEGNEKLALIEVNGTVEEVGTVIEGMNSDRVVAYGNSVASQEGLAEAIAGVCLPQDEGSITWGNKVVVGVPTSKYSLADEAKLLAKNVNYVTKEMGLVISQFGRTLSGSNADITRSKDYLKNRLAEALTSALVNSKKIPFTTQGMAVINSAMSQVGVVALGQGMLVDYIVVTPKVSDIPQNDKANRVLRGVRFIATLAGAVETIELELEVRL